jgi:hypothetical protein
MLLRRTVKAMEQGPHRFARGTSFFAVGQRQAELLGVPFAWERETAPGVGHVDKEMAPFVVTILFGPQPFVSTSGELPNH